MRIYRLTDSDRTELTSYTTSASITLSLSAPYTQAQLSLKSTADLERYLFEQNDQHTASLDFWLLITEELSGQERAIFLGPALSLDRTLRATEAGAITTDALTLSAGSPLSYMQSSSISLSGRPQGTTGHIYTLETWGPTMRELIRAPFRDNNIGRVAQRIFNYLAPPYRFPKSLSATLDAIPIIYDQARAEQYAPERARDQRAVYGLAVNTISQATPQPVIYDQARAQQYAPERARDQRAVYGLAVNTISQATPQGSPWQIISAAFDTDPNVIELFYTLEPHTAGGPLSSQLGATPAIIYRFKPFIFGAVSAPAGVQASAEITEPAKDTPHRLTSSEIISLTTSQSDADRINSAYINSPLNTTRGVESFGLLADPALDREDIERAGLRMYRANWPFFPPRLSKQNMSAHTRHIVAITSTITGEGHRYARAQAFTAYRPDLRAGLWVKLSLSRELSFVAYIDSATHSESMSETTKSRRSQFSLVRGFYIDEGPA